jgi:formamidopyrimidine-DNA glycosylase
VTEIGRRGKYIVVGLDDGATVLIHLRMSGRLYLDPPERPLAGHERVRLMLAGPTGARLELRFHDPRKFGRMLVTRRPESVLDALGVEPLGPVFDTQFLADAFARRSRRLKPLLLDQTVVAGMGNIYVDEALWEARVHPERAADTLTGGEIDRLVGSIRVVLERGIGNLGTSLGTGRANFVFPGRERNATNQEHLRVFRRTGLPCPRCGAPVQRILVAQRSTHICPRCQPPPS